MKRIIAILPLIILIASCSPELLSKHLTYKNIIIISDMSSRIRNRQLPQKDTIEIHKLITYFKNECVKPGKKIGDKSSISFSAFSDNNIISIDLDKISKLSDKQSFINSTGKFKTTGFIKELDVFESKVKSLYRNIANPGLDLISLLIEKIENQDIIKKTKFLTTDVDTTYIHFDNDIYIFTDGYLEYNSYNKRKNGQYYFGLSEIEKVRKYCIKNNIDINAALKRQDSLGLPYTKSKNNKFINLHILETTERDKDYKFQTYKHVKGLRDNEILEAVWRKWAKESGFKSFDWKKY